MLEVDVRRKNQRGDFLLKVFFLKAALLSTD